MRKFVKTLIAAAALTTSALALAPVEAATLTIDVTDIDSIDEFGDPDNFFNLYNIGAGALVNYLAYDLTIYADDPSWLSEASIYFGDSDFLTGVFLSPGFEDNFPGLASYSGSAFLPDFGLEFNVGSDGLLYVEFFEDYDDFPDDWDGFYVAGTLTVGYEPAAATAVPEPASWAMMIAGFGLVGGAMRRRTTAVSYAA